MASGSPQSSAPSDTTAPRPASGLEIVRVLILVAALVSLVLWGLGAWEMPWSIVAAVGTPVVVLLVWALFLSPRPVLYVHPFVRAALELLIYAGVTIAWWSMGHAWIGLGFAAVAVAAGLVAGRRRLA